MQQLSHKCPDSQDADNDDDNNNNRRNSNKEEHEQQDGHKHEVWDDKAAQL